MTEDTSAAAFNREGAAAFGEEATAEETAAASQAEEENQGEDTQSSEGDNTQSEEETPFHEHPRWKQREDEWNTRFNDQEKRHQDDLKAIREEFGTARKENAQNTKIPAWFGGTQEQWDAYRADRDAELTQAEERAEKRVREALKTEQGAEGKAVAEATDFMRAEMKAIEADKNLNPTGAKIDQATAEKLLKTVLDNELIDTKGRWNYRAGWRLMNGTQAAAPAPKPKPNTAEKKEIAAASTSNTRGGDNKNAPAVATSETFKKDRPW